MAGIAKTTLLSGLLALTAMAIAPETAFAQTTNSIQRGPSGLPLPRFVSLKAGSVNMRVGPGKEYAVSWRYMKKGLPLEIVQEYDNWRRVRDAEGTVGWIHGSLLSGTRTAITSPWSKDAGEAANVTLYRAPQAGAGAMAFLQPGVVGTIDTCDGAWCEMEVTANGRTIKGYANQAELWGAYPDEQFE